LASRTTPETNDAAGEQRRAIGQPRSSACPARPRGMNNHLRVEIDPFVDRDHVEPRREIGIRRLLARGCGHRVKPRIRTGYDQDLPSAACGVCPCEGDVGRRARPRPSLCPFARDPSQEPVRDDGVHRFRLRWRGGAAFEASRIAITVVKRNVEQIKGVIVLPRRRAVEGMFGWIDRPDTSPKTSRQPSNPRSHGSSSPLRSCSPGASRGCQISQRDFRVSLLA
jgi:hypothetical protein